MGVGVGLDTITAAVDSAYAWWRMAGVEDWTGESPAIWFDEPARPAPARVKTAAVSEDVAPAPVEIPRTLDALTEWLLTSQVFASVGPRTRRLAPAGPAGGTIIVVDMPELVDVDAGRLFAGPLEAQVDAVLKAVGLTRDSVYLATMLPGRTPDGRFPATLLPLATEALQRHVALVQPTRIWAMGDAAAQALFATRVTAKRRELLDFNGIPGIATIHPRLLLDDPDRERRKAMWPLMQLLFPKE
jgi:uracil-DNA glycosylase family 4